VVGETPSDEPVVAVGNDRLVLRREGSGFWAAATCDSCGQETASVDLADHKDSCPVLHPATATAYGASRPETSRPRVRSGPSRTRAALDVSRRLPLPVENRSTARVFGTRRSTVTADLAIFIAVVVAGVLVLAVVLGIDPSTWV
jgi:hypothetical protein